MSAQTAFAKCAKTFNATAKALAEKTKDAYSAERYGKKCWLAQTKFLLIHFTEEQVEWILRSKHMRWAADKFETARGVPLKTMEKWYADGSLDSDDEMPGNAFHAAATLKRKKIEKITALRAEAQRLMSEANKLVSELV